ncbi:MAG: prepilin-type N-terminal cleavage/methylation domain-containing protein [Arcobacteraceae bacterium]|nr:prepilin-type N-terminal cleavage/methylation domain-containing protein [Arcobacteraceae bacterium]
MTNLLKSQNTSKKGFTLFEVLISLVILGVVLASVSKIFVKNDDIKTYYELQKIENNYIETKTIQNSEKIKFKHN